MMREITNATAIPERPSRSNLMRLLTLRTVMIGFLIAVTAVLHYLHIPLPDLPVILAVSGMILLNLITLFRLKKHQDIHALEIFTQLLGDIFALTVLFYFTGGYSNPLVWMYLLPLTVATVTLQRMLVLILGALMVTCYTVLIFRYVPLSHLHMHYINGRGLDIHLLGMWLGFIVSASIISLFVTKISQNLRDYDKLIAQAREQALESERMLALGTLATAAAHELGTPLATMAVVTQEMAHDHANNLEIKEYIPILQAQIKHCKTILTSISRSAGQSRAEDGYGLDLDVFLQQTLNRWQDARPTTQIHCKIEAATPAPTIAIDRTFGHAIINLLDNAADASPEKIEVYGTWTNTANHLELLLTIRDFGTGLTPDVADKVGTLFYTTKKESGLGLGLYLSKLILQRFGGTVKLFNHAQGGTLTEIKVPLQALLIGMQWKT